jgi:fructose-bisphosphate aldolase class II
MTDKPIVLHGGTGLTEDEFRSFIAAGVSKINISTAVKRSYMQSSFEFLKIAEERNEWHPASMFRSVQGAIGAMVSEYFDIFGSAGRIPTHGT